LGSSFLSRGQIASQLDWGGEFGVRKLVAVWITCLVGDLMLVILGGEVDLMSDRIGSVTGLTLVTLLKSLIKNDLHSEESTSGVVSDVVDGLDLVDLSFLKSDDTLEGSLKLSLWEWHGTFEVVVDSH
jgi:hypothetical protein